MYREERRRSWVCNCIDLDFENFVFFNISIHTNGNETHLSLLESQSIPYSLR